MSRPDVGQLSSNWKKLQEKLKTERKQQPAQSNGLKRKRGPPTSKAATNGAIKKIRLSAADTNRTLKKRTMGVYLSTASSKPPPPPTREEGAAKLIREYDIDPTDITAAYGSTTPLTRTHSDQINGGLHPRHKVGKYVALDCEMVGTGPPPHDDNVLARASLVNFHGEQIYDSYVQAPPKTAVEDYRTFVSGIQQQHMQPGYARPFAEVQHAVAQLLDGRILVGHALRNDLNTLLLAHPKRDLRDTSRHPKFRIESKGKPPALRKLAKSELGMEIQIGAHSSVEDARAAMMLFKKERAGFEEENRKHFGRRTRLTSAGGNGDDKRATPRVEDDGFEEDEAEDEDEDEDLAFLDGEAGDEEPDDGLQSTRKPTQPRTKKRKSKKRTKRK